MAELTPEERHRIYEEEKVRLEARKKLEPAKSHTAAKVALLIALLFILTLIIGSQSEHFATTATAPSRSTSGTKSLRGTYWCGESFDDAGQTGIAVFRGDTAALAACWRVGEPFRWKKELVL
jgi:hypothetical protein